MELVPHWTDHTLELVGHTDFKNYTCDYWDCAYPSISVTKNSITCPLPKSKFLDDMIVSECTEGPDADLVFLVRNPHGDVLNGSMHLLYYDPMFGLGRIVHRTECNNIIVKEHNTGLAVGFILLWIVLTVQVLWFIYKRWKLQKARAMLENPYLEANDQIENATDL